MSTALSLAPQGKPPSSHVPSDITLLNSIKFGYLEYRLLNGSMGKYTSCRKKLVDALEKFWSVWLWRWDVQKSGCGGVDFEQLLGLLQLPHLHAQQIPKRLSNHLNTFIQKTCSETGSIPILMNQKRLVHLPGPTDQITQQDINSLARYLLTLLEGSEARTESRQSTQPSSPPPLNILSNLAIRSIDGIQEVSMKGLGESSKWAHRAFSWASASFASNSLALRLDENAQAVGNLDEQLRAEMGLDISPPPVKLNDPKQSAPSDPKLVDNDPNHEIRLRRSGSMRGSCVAAGRQSSTNEMIGHTTSTQPYPHNLSNLYPPKLTEIDHDQYPHNLLHLYPAQIPQDNQLFNVSRKRTAPCSIVTAQTQVTTSESSSAQRLTRSMSILNPRSPRYNVEFALADAMSEKDPGSDAISPIEAFVRHRMLSNPLISEGMGDQTVIKNLSIFVGNGELAAEVIWLQREHWTLAIITPSAESANSTTPSLPSPLLTESLRLLYRLYAQWPDQTSNARSNETVKKGCPNQRFLLQLKTNEMFYQQSSAQSSWLSKNELWSGKQTNEKEAEICFGVLECMKDQPTENFPVEECFIRTESGQWIVNKKIPKSIISPNTEIDAVLVLPTGSGTLIEADNEMRKLERVCEQVDFSSWK